MRIRYTLNYLSRGLGGTRAHVSTDLLRNGRKQGVIVTISKPTNNLVPYFWVFQIKKTIFRIGRKQGDNNPNDGNNPRNPVDVCATPLALGSPIEFNNRYLRLRRGNDSPKRRGARPDTAWPVKLHVSCM